MPNRATTVEEWKQRNRAQQKFVVGDPFPLNLPSGNVVLVRPVGMEAFLDLGFIPNALRPMMQDVLDQARAGKKVTEKQLADQAQKAIENMDRIGEVVEMADAITCYVVIEPRIEPKPPRDAEGKETGRRVKTKLYVDE